MKNIQQEVTNSLLLLKDIKVTDYVLDTLGIGTSTAEEYEQTAEDILKISENSKEDDHGLMVKLKTPIEGAQYIRIGKPGELNYVGVKVDNFEQAKKTYPEAEYKEGEGWKLLEIKTELGKLYLSDISEIEFYFPKNAETKQSILEEDEVYEAEANTDTEGMFQQKFEDEKQRRLSLMADFQNFQRRMDQEKSTWGALSNMSLIKDVLEVDDDLELALNDGNLDLNHAKSAIKSAQDKLVDAIKRAGVEKIEVKVGDEFDKEKMEAVSMVQAQEEGQKNKVIAVISSAFKYIGKDFILRAAKVVVGK